MCTSIRSKLTASQRSLPHVSDVNKTNFSRPRPKTQGQKPDQGQQLQTLTVPSLSRHTRSSISQIYSICKAPLKQSSQRRLLWVGLHKEPSLKARLELFATNINVLEIKWQHVPNLGCGDAETAQTITRGPSIGLRVMQHTYISLPQSSTLGLHPVAGKLLLIFRPAKGRRLSWAHSRLATCLMLLANDSSEIRTANW